MNNRFYKIGEASKILGLPASTIRYWETEFGKLRPVKSSGGQRFYTEKHIELLRKLKTMLYDEKYTVEGAKKKLKEESRELSSSSGRGSETIEKTGPRPLSSEDIRRELEEILAILE